MKAFMSLTKGSGTGLHQVFDAWSIEQAALSAITTADLV